METKNGNKIDFSLFKKSIKNMVATSENSYKNRYSFIKGDHHNTYSKEEILDILKNGDSEELKEASRSFFYSSGFYRRLLVYLSSLPNFPYVVVPKALGTATPNKDTFLKKYNAALAFVDSLDLRVTGSDILLTILRDGAYYGLACTDGKKITLQSLPSRYCRSRFKDENGIDLVEINLQYFNTIPEKAARDACLNNYPKYIKTAYNKYSNKGGDNWGFLEPQDALYIDLYEEKPFFLNVIPAILDFEEYREIEKAKDIQDIQRILVQHLPLDKDGDLAFEPEEAEEMHTGAVQMLKGNRAIDVLTTYAEVSLEDMESSRSTVSNNLEKIENTVYSEEGVSKQLFAAEGQTGLKYSNLNDSSLVFLAVNKMSVWIQFTLNHYFSNSKINFSFRILEITQYNKQEEVKTSLSMAQSGFSFIEPYVQNGGLQSEILSIKDLEIDYLGLDKKLIPLSSSFTQSQSTNTNSNDVNKKSEGDLTEKTIKNKNAQS